MVNTYSQEGGKKIRKKEGSHCQHRKRDLSERARRILEAHCGPEHVLVAKPLANLAAAHGDLGDAATMRDLLERALGLEEEHYGPEHVDVAKTRKAKFVLTPG